MLARLQSLAAAAYNLIASGLHGIHVAAVKAGKMTESRAAHAELVVEGLSSWQCEELVGVKVGDLLEVAVFTRGEREDDEAGSDDGGNDDDRSGDEAGGDESDGDYGSEGDADEGSSEGGSEDDGPATPTAAHTVSAMKATSATDTQPRELLSESEWEENIRYAGRVPWQNTDGFHDGSRDQDATAASGTGTAIGEQVAQDAQSSDGRGEDFHSGAEQHDYQSESEVESEDDRDYDADEDAGLHDGEAEDDHECLNAVSHNLYVVVEVIQGGECGEAVVKDVRLRRLVYEGGGEERGFDTYRIYGNTIDVEDEAVTRKANEELHSLTEMATAEAPAAINIVLNPTGDHLRRSIFKHSCPARCDDGWLPDQSHLQDLISEDLEVLLPYHPLCPVCLGKDLMNEQIILRHILDATHIVDIGLIVEYLGRLNPRRRQLGYSFTQFDEREWGYGFDDLLDEDISQTHEDDDRVYERWDEAMDPNANAQTRPASAAVIAALPRKTYEQVVRKREGHFCTICRGDAFEGADEVVELGCGHVYDEECLVAWVGQYDSCPECRRTVSGMAEIGDADAAFGEDSGGGEEIDGEAAVDGEPKTPDPAEVDGEAGALQATMTDGDDTIMSDAL